MLGSGIAVLVGTVLMLFAAAYLRGGHPPASGIVNLVLLLLLSPAAGLAAAVGLRAAGTVDKWFFVMTGVCLGFAVFAGTLLLLKVVLGRAV